MVIDLGLVRVVNSSIIFTILSAQYFNLFNFFKWDFRVGFDSLVDLWATDYLLDASKLAQRPRFEVNYKFNSLRNSIVSLVYSFHFPNFMNCIIPSVSELYLSAPWLEREMWDMFGLYFFGNNDMRRLLTDYGFVGHPFRKDFPLTGYSELRFDETSRMVIYESVSLTQNVRNFGYVAAQNWSELFAFISNYIWPF